MDENHTQAQVQAGMPFLVQLQNIFGVATNYIAPTHPSLPSYLMITGGSFLRSHGRCRARVALDFQNICVRRCG